MPELAAHLERVAKAQELVNHILEYVDEGQLDEYADIAQEAMVNPVAAALAACARESRKEAIQETLAIYERAFEQNWVVQDAIDAIRALTEESNGQHV